MLSLCLSTTSSILIPGVHVTHSKCEDQTQMLGNLTLISLYLHEKSIL
jgi:hypothetical protein